MVRACMNPEASNFGEDINGNFVGDQENVLPFEPICRFVTPEEESAIDLGIKNYTTEEEAILKGSTPTTDRERNRSAYNTRGQEKSNAPFLGLGLLAYIFMS